MICCKKCDKYITVNDAERAEDFGASGFTIIFVCSHCGTEHTSIIMDYQMEVPEISESHDADS